MKQVKIPLEEDSTFWILIPFVLFSATNFTVVSGRPLGYWTIFIESIEFPDNIAFKIPLSIFSPLIEFTIEIFGALVYPFPPLRTIMLLIVFEFLIDIRGDIYAIGCKVLSEEYSKP